MRNHIFKPVHIEHQRRIFELAGFENYEWIIDVGANIGYTSLLYALLFPRTKILALEPSRVNYQFLSYNCRNSPHIQAICLGAHHEVSTGVLSLPKERDDAFLIAKSSFNSGLLSLYGDGGRRSERIQLKPLDDLLDDKVFEGGIGFVKIDIEGNELNALKGAKKTLRDHSPILEIEANPRAFEAANSSFSSLTGFLSAYGYVPYVLEGQGLKLYTPDNVNETMNVIFICDA